MTEDEAKIKRCCGGSGCGKSTAHYASDRMCVGSECMAWRWDTSSLVIEHDDRGVLFRTKYELGGHCGLAGKP
jgi:hypothetical protein